MGKSPRNIQKDAHVVSHKEESVIDGDLCLSILRGQFPDKPEVVNTFKSLLENRVKTFVVYNCTDFRFESDILFSETQKFVQKFAAKHGFSFMFADPWSCLQLRNDVSPMDFELLMSDLDGTGFSSGFSISPRALILHSETYGDTRLPMRLSEEHFSMMVDVSKSAGIDCKTLQEWYSLDEQNDPPVYELKEINEVYRRYQSLNPKAKKDAKAEASALWAVSRANLARELTGLTLASAKKGLLTTEEYKTFKASGFETMAEQSMDQKSSAVENSIIFSRKFDKIDVKEEAAVNFLDCEGGVVSPIGLKKSEHWMKEAKQKVPQKFIRRKNIAWKPQLGMSLDEKSHQIYLSYFQTQNYLDITRRIAAAKFNQSSSLSFFKNDQLKNLFMDCVSQLVHVDQSVLPNSVARDGIVEWIFDTIIENKQVLLIPTEMDQNNYDWTGIDQSRGTRTAQSVTTGGFSRSRMAETRQKMTSTPTGLSRTGTLLKMNRANTKDTFKTIDKPDSSAFHRRDSFGYTPQDENLDDDKVLPVLDDQDFPDFDPTGEQLLFDQSLNYAPFFITGVANSGKTTIAATLFKYANTYLPDYSVIGRFCNSVDYSRTFFDVLFSLVTQLSRLLKEDMKVPQTINECVDMFKYLCTIKSPVLETRPILIIIDQLESLQCRDKELCRSLSWLPESFSEKIIFIFSIGKWTVDLMTSAKAVSKESWRHFELPQNLSFATCQTYLEELMKKQKRSLFSGQKQTIMKSLHNEPNMLFLDLLTRQVLLWRKRLEKPLFKYESLGSLIEECFIGKGNKLLGKNAVKHFCSLLCTSENGLSEVEILDLMSYDDDSLKDVFTALGFPSQGNIVRFPLTWWLRLKKHFEAILTEEKRDGCFLIKWKNSSVDETFQRKFILGNPENKMRYNTLLLNYFLNRLEPKKSFAMTVCGENKEILNANRCISQQYLKVSEVVYNIRAMSQIAYYLTQTNQIEEIIGHYGKFKTLLYLLRGQSVGTVVARIERCVSKLLSVGVVEQQLTDLLNILKSNQSILAENPNYLFQILQTCIFDEQTGSHFISNMKKDALEWFRRSTTPHLLSANVYSLANKNIELKKDTKSNPEKVIPLEMNIRSVKQLSSQSEWLMSPFAGGSHRVLDTRSNTLREQLVNVSFELYYPLYEKIGLVWDGKEWLLLNESNGTPILFAREDFNHALESSVVIIPSSLNLGFLAAKHQNHEALSELELEHSEEISDIDDDNESSSSNSKDSLPKTTVMELFSFKTKEWYKLPELDEWEMEKVMFVVPYFESADNLYIVVILNDGHVIMFSEKVEWEPKMGDEDADPNGEANGMFGNGGDINYPFNEGDDERMETKYNKIDFHNSKDENEFEAKVHDGNAPETPTGFAAPFGTDANDNSNLDNEEEKNEDDEDEKEGDQSGADKAPRFDSANWKRVNIPCKQILRIDVSNDPIKATNLPILHKNILLVFTQSSMLMIELNNLQFTRFASDQFYDFNDAQGLVITKQPEDRKGSLFKLENQQTLTHIPDQQHFLSFVPTRNNLILGQKGSLITLYSFDLEARASKMISKLYQIEDPLINPQIAAKTTLLDKLVVFTEMGLSVYSLDQLIKGKKKCAQMYDHFIAEMETKQDAETKEIKQTNTKQFFLDVESNESHIVLAKSNSLEMLKFNAVESRFLLEKNIELDWATFGQFKSFIASSRIKETEGQRSNMLAFLSKKNNTILVNTYNKEKEIFDSDSLIIEETGESELVIRDSFFACLDRNNQVKLYDSKTGALMMTRQNDDDAQFRDFAVVNKSKGEGSKVETAFVFLWNKKLMIDNKEFFFSNSTSESLEDAKRILAAPTGLNECVVISFGDGERLSVFKKSSDGHTKELKLIFKNPILSVAMINSTRIILSDVNRFYTFDTETAQIVNTTKATLRAPEKSRSENITILKMQVEQQDFRVASCLFTFNDNIIRFAFIDTTTGQPICETILENKNNNDSKFLSNYLDGVHNKSYKFGVKLSWEQKSILIAESSPQETVVNVFVLLWNPAVDFVLSKIKLEFPAPVKIAHKIVSQFSPLLKESLNSTRPVNFTSLAV